MDPNAGAAQPHTPNPLVAAVMNDAELLDADLIAPDAAALAQQPNVDAAAGALEEAEGADDDDGEDPLIAQFENDNFWQLVQQSGRDPKTLGAFDEGVQQMHRDWWAHATMEQGQQRKTARLAAMGEPNQQQEAKQEEETKEQQEEKSSDTQAGAATSSSDATSSASSAQPSESTSFIGEWSDERLAKQRLALYEEAQQGWQLTPEAMRAVLQMAFSAASNEQPLSHFPVELISLVADYAMPPPADQVVVPHPPGPFAMGDFAVDMEGLKRLVWRWVARQMTREEATQLLARHNILLAGAREEAAALGFKMDEREFEIEFQGGEDGCGGRGRAAGRRTSAGRVSTHSELEVWRRRLST